MAKPRALITGITGMVGSHLAEYLIECTDWDVYGMCRWRSPLDNLENLIPRINRKDRCYLLYGDLRDTLAIQDVVRKAQPDYVFHLAAQTLVGTANEDPVPTFETNIRGTWLVLEACRRHHRYPELAHESAHRRARPDAAQQLVLFLQHVSVSRTAYPLSPTISL